MKKVILITFILSTFQAVAQNTPQQINAGQKLIEGLQNPGNFSIGGYSQIDYNEVDGATPGNLDVHRFVLLFAYKFNNKVSFLTEIEYEHVKEVFVEQAYLKYRLGNNASILAGLMLVPMGIINEYHEPTTFYGVERPSTDTYIVPSTWREMGIGISGRLDAASLKYQAYLFNGFISYENGFGTLRGIDGLRKGRQKGITAVVNTPNFSTKLDYYGVRGLRVGIAGYFGETQTDDTTLENTTVHVTMLGTDARYRIHNLELRGQYIYTKLSNTANYNLLMITDLGSEMYGFYTEVAYNINLRNNEKITPFLRFEKYNTHAKTEGTLVKNKRYDRSEYTFGLNYKVAEGATFKIDYQIADNAETGSNVKNQFNAGIGVWF